MARSTVQTRTVGEYCDFQSRQLWFCLPTLAQPLHLLVDSRQVVVPVGVVPNVNDAGGRFYHNRPGQALDVDDRSKIAVPECSALKIRNGRLDHPMTSILCSNANLDSHVPALRVWFR